MGSGRESGLRRRVNHKWEKRERVGEWKREWTQTKGKSQVEEEREGWGVEESGLRRRVSHKWEKRERVGEWKREWTQTKGKSQVGEERGVGRGRESGTLTRLMKGKTQIQGPDDLSLSIRYIV